MTDTTQPMTDSDRSLGLLDGPLLDGDFVAAFAGLPEVEDVKFSPECTTQGKEAVLLIDIDDSLSEDERKEFGARARAALTAYFADKRLSEVIETVDEAHDHVDLRSDEDISKQLMERLLVIEGYLDDVPELAPGGEDASGLDVRLSDGTRYKLYQQLASEYLHDGIAASIEHPITHELRDDADVDSLDDAEMEDVRMVDAEDEYLIKLRFTNVVAKPVSGTRLNGERIPSDYLSPDESLDSLSKLSGTHSDDSLPRLNE